jgi:hypothetical protein
MFKIADMRSMKERPMEYYPTTDNETISLGEALVLDSGSLKKCGVTTTPEFIAMKAVTDIETIPVVRVNEDVVLETTFAADGSSIVEGDKVTIHTDGLQVTATTTNGVFYVVKKLGSGAIGTYVRGMFRR